MGACSAHVLWRHSQRGQRDPQLLLFPQAVSVGDVRRELTFCRKAGLHILGIVENMSGFVCPHCSVSSPELPVQPWGCSGPFLVVVGWRIGKCHEGEPGRGDTASFGLFCAEERGRAGHRECLGLQGGGELALLRAGSSCPVTQGSGLPDSLLFLLQECTNIFSKGGGEELAKHAGVPFLGCVPLDPELSQSLEEGRDFIQEFPKSSAFPALTHIAQQILDTSQRSS